MNLSDLKKTSDTHYQTELTFSPIMPNGIKSETLKLTVLSAKNEKIRAKMVKLGRKRDELRAQLEKAKDDNPISELTKRIDAVMKEMAQRLLVGFTGLKDGKKEVECTDDSKKMLCDYSWIAEEIITQATETSDFLGK